MKRLTTFCAAALLIALLPACSKDDTRDYSFLEGLKGKWAPVTDDCLTDKFIEFDRGQFILWNTGKSLLAADCALWNVQNQPIVQTREEYGFQDGRLRAGKNDLGVCRIAGDSLYLGSQPYFRLKAINDGPYTHLDFGEGVDPERPEILLSKRDSTYTIPCTLARPLLSSVRIEVRDASIHVNHIQVKKSQADGRPDSLTFHIDANDSQERRLSTFSLTHPACGLVPVTLTQLPVPASIVVPDELLSLNVGSERTEIQIPYSVIGRIAGENLRCTPNFSWIEMGDIGTKAFTFTVKANNSDARLGSVTLSYPHAENIIIVIQQRAYGN